jgi:hypothetical protein
MYSGAEYHNYGLTTEKDGLRRAQIVGSPLGVHVVISQRISNPYNVDAADILAQREREVQTSSNYCWGATDLFQRYNQRLPWDST